MTLVLGRTSQLKIRQAGDCYFVEAFLHDECRSSSSKQCVIQFAMLVATVSDTSSFLQLRLLIGITGGGLVREIPLPISSRRCTRSVELSGV